MARWSSSAGVGSQWDGGDGGIDEGSVGEDSGGGDGVAVGLIVEVQGGGSAGRGAERDCGSNGRIAVWERLKRGVV